MQHFTDFPCVKPFDLPEGEGVCMFWGKIRKTFGELIEKFLLPEEIGRIGAPIGRSGRPVSGCVKNVFPGPLGGIVIQGYLPRSPPEMVDDLVLEDADQPGRFRRFSRKRFPVLQCREEGLLDEVLRNGRVSQPEHGITKKIVSVAGHPVDGIDLFRLPHNFVYPMFKRERQRKPPPKERGSVLLPFRRQSFYVWKEFHDSCDRPVEWKRGRRQQGQSAVTLMRAEGIVEPFVTTVETGWWTTCLEILPTKERARGKYGPVPLRRSLSSPHSPFCFLMILGMKNEKTKRATEKITLKERRPPQFPLAQTSRTVPTKKVKMKVPTMIPRPVPKT